MNFILFIVGCLFVIAGAMIIPLPVWRVIIGLIVIVTGLLFITAAQIREDDRKYYGSE